MTPLKIFITGPMTSLPHCNFPAFDRLRDKLIAQGHTPISSADIARRAGVNPDNPRSTHLTSDTACLHATIRHNIDALLTCDAIVLLPNWELCPGARAFNALAKYAGIMVFHPYESIPAATTTYPHAS